MRFSGSVSFSAVLIATVACGSAGTDLNQLVNSNGSGDAATESGNPPPTAYQDPFANAPPFGSAGGGGGDSSHNPGRACMQQGCHGNQGSQGGGEGSAFLIGGTVYQDYYGTVPAVGIEVRIVDGAGNNAITVSDSNGNFHIQAGQGNVTFPAIIGARSATTTRPMIRQLTSPTMGSCAQSPCHISPNGSPATGVYFPIHVP